MFNFLSFVPPPPICLCACECVCDRETGCCKHIHRRARGMNSDCQPGSPRVPWRNPVIQIQTRCQTCGLKFQFFNHNFFKLNELIFCLPYIVDLLFAFSYCTISSVDISSIFHHIMSFCVLHIDACKVLFGVVNQFSLMYAGPFGVHNQCTKPSLEHVFTKHVVRLFFVVSQSNSENVLGRLLFFKRDKLVLGQRFHIQYNLLTYSTMLGN